MGSTMNKNLQGNFSKRQMVYLRGNQRETSPHYVFLYSDDENNSDNEDIPLRSCKGSTSNPQKIEVINVQLKPDDTLQALALRYRCQISELKRINKIHKENEIFALRCIKVPVCPYSVLTEPLDETQLVPYDDTNKSTQIQESVVTRNDTASTTAVTTSSQPEINTIILNSLCEPLPSHNNTNTPEVNYNECDRLIDSTVENAKAHVTDTLKCSGDDCGLSWLHLLGFSLLLGFAAPIVYILYIAEFSSNIHSTLSH